ncbi:MAG: insulinase family protein [Candidatus Zixiibacteriota bacterium]|nr:MAG: insulinase family protein [candidate division Zixibacteria bacterium]
MKRLILALALLLGMTAGVRADEPKTQGGPIIPATGVSEHILPNGLRILAWEDHSAPVVSYQVWFNVGSRNERPGITGISHLFEHMMFKGSKKYGPEEHANIVQAQGGRLNAFTSNDMTVYYENIASDKLELVVAMEAERQANLAITAENLASEREVVKEERRMRTDNNVFGDVVEQLMANAYTAHPYQWPIVGWMSDLNAITLEDCREYHRIHYAPNNATVVIVGDFKTEDAVKTVEKYYGAIPAQEPPPEVATVEPPQRGERRVYLHRRAQLPMLFGGYHIPEMAHEDMPALAVAQKILSDGESSRIYRKMVYEDQIALYAGGAADEAKDPSLFYAYCGMAIGHDIEAGEKALFGIIEGMAQNPPTPEELQKAKNQLEADFILAMQTNSRKANNLGMYQTVAGDWRLLFEIPSKYQAVTAEKVAEVVGKYFVPTNRTTVILIPENEPMGQR